MKTTRPALFVLPTLLFACLGPTGSESAGALARPGEVPAAGDPCQDDACVDGQTLAVCVDGTVFQTIDCSANRGACERRGSRDQCVAVGWVCEDHCIDEHTLSLCWDDLRVTEDHCEAGCDPAGVRHPDTGETSAWCLPEPAEACECDSYETDPAHPTCCDPGCDCDLDCTVDAAVCGAEGGDDSGQGGELACPCDSYFSDPAQPMCCDAACDCDFDCGDGAPACGAEGDGGDGGGGAPDVPDAWTCDPWFYGAFDGCDCECGIYDPDCLDPNQTVFNCQDGQSCDADGRCVDG